MEKEKILIIVMIYDSFAIFTIIKFYTIKGLLFMFIKLI